MGRHRAILTSGTIAVCVSLLLHGLAYRTIVEEKIKDLTVLLARGFPAGWGLTLTLKLGDSDAGGDPDAGGADAPPPPMPQPPPEVILLEPPPPPPFVMEEPERLPLGGEENGKGQAINSSAGDQPALARAGDQDQAALSRDPVGPGRPGRPSPNTARPGDGGSGPGARAARQPLIAGIPDASPTPFGVPPAPAIPQPRARRVLPPPPPPPAPVYVALPPPPPIGHVIGLRNGRRPPESDRDNPATRPALVKGPTTRDAAAVTENPTYITTFGGTGKHPAPATRPALARDYDPATTRPVAIAADQPTTRGAIVQKDDVLAPRPELADKPDAPSTRPTLAATGDPTTRPTVAQADPTTRPAIVARDAPATRPTLAQLPTTGPIALLPGRPRPIGQPGQALEAPAATGGGGRPGAPAPAADPFPQSDQDSDPFTAKSATLVYRNGRLEARNGRKIKFVRPDIGDKGWLDLMGMRNPHVVLQLDVDPKGKVTNVRMPGPTGSKEVDLPVEISAYLAYVEPLKDPATGKPIPDTVFVTIGFR